MIRTARIFPPLIALAMASVFAIPQHSHAEPAVAVPAETNAIVTLDPLEDMLAGLRSKALFVGRDGNLGYAILNFDQAYYLRAQPNGQVRISKADFIKVRAFAVAHGWRI